jgi:hypothetical protein
MRSWSISSPNRHMSPWDSSRSGKFGVCGAFHEDALRQQAQSILAVYLAQNIVRQVQAIDVPPALP